LVRRILKNIHEHLRRSGKVSSPAESAKGTRKKSALKVEHKSEKSEKQEIYRPGEGSSSTSRRLAYEKKPVPRKKPVPEKSRTTSPPERKQEKKPREKQAPRWDAASFEVAHEAGKTRFHDLDLPAEVMHAIHDLGFKYCTPIQAQILPHTLTGRDASGRAQTGTGKTAAFLITIFSRLLRESPGANRRGGTPRALILAPTRELVIQIAKEAEALGKYCKVKVLAVYGGVDYKKQKADLGHTVDVVVATPGRLLDFKRQRAIHLSRIEILVIDEADRMLDMGFIPDVRSIVRSTPSHMHRQTMLFSATLTPEVTRLASQWTHNSVTVEVEPEKVTVDTVKQIVYIVSGEEKFTVLYNLLKREAGKSVLVFANRRDETQGLMRKLRAYGIACALLSGAVPQEKRQKTLEAFRSGQVRVLVATDVAGRGLHVEGIGHVVNYSLPHDPEDYVHRIGRTGRAGETGTAVSFACEADSFFIPDIEKYIGNEIKCTFPEDDLLVQPPEPKPQPQSYAKPRPRHRSNAPRRKPSRGNRK